MTTRIHDSLGVEIRVGDTLTVIGYGWAVRLVDTGRRVTCIGFTRGGNVVHDGGVSHGANPLDLVADARAIRPTCLAVARRDGFPGHEGNHVCDVCGDPVHSPTGAGRAASCAPTHGTAQTPARGDEHVVEIVDAVPGAVKIRGAELRRGDYVFGTNGGRYKIISLYTKGARVVFRRNDMQQDSIGNDESITVLRSTDGPGGP